MATALSGHVFARLKGTPLEATDMDVWLFVLYAAAAILALRSLVSLMVQHREAYRQQKLIENQIRQRRARKLAKQQTDRAA
jgi:hypothetical protein